MCSKYLLCCCIAPLLTGFFFLSCHSKKVQKHSAVSDLRAVSPNIIFEETFEGHNIFDGTRKQFGTEYAFQIVTDIVNNGEKSGRFELRADDPLTSNGTRAEVLVPQRAVSKEGWYAFSVYLPSTYWQADRKQDIITQWHQGPTNPPLSLRMLNGRMYLDIRTMASTKNEVPITGWDPAPLDQWLNMVFHISFDNKSGITDLWVNGKKLLEYRGGNCFAESDLAAGTTEIIPHWKLGIYKSDWNGSKTSDTYRRVLYFDDIKVGSDKATLSEMIGNENSLLNTLFTEKKIRSEVTKNDDKLKHLLVNAGGGNYEDKQTRTWSADKDFKSGVCASKSISVDGTSDDALYNHYRYADAGKTFGYGVPVTSSGTYTVKLHFVEPYFKSAGSRVFNVALEGHGVLNDYDVYREAGFGRAVVKTFTGVSVTDGQLNIDLTSEKNNAIISAIEVLKE